MFLKTCYAERGISKRNVSEQKRGIRAISSRRQDGTGEGMWRIPESKFLGKRTYEKSKQ